MAKYTLVEARDTEQLLAVDDVITVGTDEHKVKDADKANKFFAELDVKADEAALVKLFADAKDIGLEKVEVKKEEPKKDDKKGGADKGGFLSTLWSHVTCPFRRGYALCTTNKATTVLSVCALGLAVAAVACRMNGTSLTTVCSKLFENTTGRSL